MEETLLGLSLGLAAGVSPGPLLTMVVEATLRGGFAAGARVAAAPLVSDLPMIAVAVLAVDRIPEAAQALLSLAGGFVVIWIARGTWLHSADVPAPGGAAGPAGERSKLLAAVVVNGLNPHAWLFWGTVGAPLLLAAWPGRPGAAAGFLIAFFSLLIGAKVALAGAIAGNRHRLGEQGYRRLMLGCSVLLLGLGVMLVVRGALGLA